MQRAFTNALEKLETEALVESDRFGFYIGNYTDTTGGVALLQREKQDVAEKRTPESEPAGALVDVRASPA